MSRPGGGGCGGLHWLVHNVIYIDRPSNRKTRLEVVWTIYCFLKIACFHTPQHNFKTLPVSSKLQQENDKKSCLKYSIHCCSPTHFPLPFFYRGRYMSAGSRIKLKFTGHAQQNAPANASLWSRDHVKLVGFRHNLANGMQGQPSSSSKQQRRSEKMVSFRDCEIYLVFLLLIKFHGSGKCEIYSPVQRILQYILPFTTWSANETPTLYFRT